MTTIHFPDRSVGIVVGDINVIPPIVSFYGVKMKMETLKVANFACAIIALGIGMVYLTYITRSIPLKNLKTLEMFMVSSSCLTFLTSFHLCHFHRIMPKCFYKVCPSHADYVKRRITYSKNNSEPVTVVGEFTLVAPIQEEDVITNQ